MKTLIIYATKYGTAEKVARQNASYLEGEVRLVNLKKENPPLLQGYDRVILGGSIYIGRIQKEMREYVETHLGELLAKPVGLYLCAGEQDQETLRKEMETAFPKKLRDHAVVKEIVGYEFRMESLHFFDRLILSKMKKVDKTQLRLDEDKVRKVAELFQRSR